MNTCKVFMRENNQPLEATPDSCGWMQKASPLMVGIATNIRQRPNSGGFYFPYLEVPFKFCPGCGRELEAVIREEDDSR